MESSRSRPKQPRARAIAIAIGVMARAPAPGRCKTRLAAHVGDELAAELCRVMLLDTLDRIESSVRDRDRRGHDDRDPSRATETRLVVMAAPENDGVAALRALVPSTWEVIVQQGEGLGARLAHAFGVLENRDERDENANENANANANTNDEARRTADCVALVDADSPTAPWPDAVRALEALQGPRRACMGPCEDGGYWLIALTTIELGILDDIAWSTKAVAEQTRDRCRSLGIALEELATAYDIDEPRDLGRLQDELRDHPDRAPRTAALMSRVLASSASPSLPLTATRRTT